MIQLRDKAATTAQRIETARALKAVLAGTGVFLIINDDVQAAVEADVHGAHIGQDDMTVARARAMLGPDRILGLSCETEEAVRAADARLVDYLGLSPVFGTTTKMDHKHPLGFEGLARLVACSPLPTIAVGGLNATHTSAVLATGVDGIAVAAAICGQPDPRAAAGAFRFPSGWRH